MEFLKANGIEDAGLMKEMDYQEVLNQQEIFGEELYMFSNKEMQKEVRMSRSRERHGEAGWGGVGCGWGAVGGRARRAGGETGEGEKGVRAVNEEWMGE